MIKVVFFDAGGVLFLNYNGEALVNDKVINFINSHQDLYKFGVLSSTKLPLKNIIASHGLVHYFSIIQTTGGIKLEKDVRAFYISAIEALGVRPGEAVMVDNDKGFIKAAKKAGLNTVIYTEGIDLDYAISNVSG